MNGKNLIISASLAALLAVAFGAFGAHGLKDQLSEVEMVIYRTAVDYHMWHALGLALIGLLAERYPEASGFRWAGAAMIIGLLLFSGSLYALSLSGLRWLGMITPLGGLSFMTGWALVALTLMGMPKQPN
jgi:uncharacterized membrane protein YgdD (TMEM256/DUF423 family)